MVLDIDPGNGSARLDRAGVEALLAAARGEPADPSATVVLASGRLDPALAALRDPDVTLELVVAGPQARLEHRGWVAPELAVVLAAAHDGPGPAAQWRLLTMPPAFLTAGLVRLTRIRPRRDVADTLAGAWSDDLVATDALRRRAALAAAGADFAWRLHAASRDGGERVLAAVDGARGLHLADPLGGALRRVSNTVGYRVLSTLLLADAADGTADAAADQVSG